VRWIQLNTISSLQKLRDPEYRKAFVASQINIGIPFQIRAMLNARGKKQDWLVERTGMRQPRISGLMTPGKTRPNIETLRRIADAFDCGLAVRFVPFTELVRWSEEFEPDTFQVPDFDAEMAARERAAAIRSAGMAENQPLNHWKKYLGGNTSERTARLTVPHPHAACTFGESKGMIHLVQQTGQLSLPLSSLPDLSAQALRIAEPRVA